MPWIVFDYSRESKDVAATRNSSPEAMSFERFGPGLGPAGFPPGHFCAAETEMITEADAAVLLIDSDPSRVGVGTVAPDRRRLYGKWRQDAELVFFGVGEHRPSHIVTLADLCGSSTKR
ncbi:hypothetical protein BH18ACT15_BH18ACT15_10300 [soil metagenome]